MDNPNKNNRTLPVLAIVTIVLALATFYLYKLPPQTPTTVNPQITQNTATPTEDPNLIATIDPVAKMVVRSSDLPPATVGQNYQQNIQIFVPDFNNLFIGEVTSGLPSGLQMAPCSTEFNNPDFAAKNSTKNSLVKCPITGTPRQSGHYNITVHFTLKDNFGYFDIDFPLTVNP